jgi:hypothetical protein
MIVKDEPTNSTSWFITTPLKWKHKGDNVYFSKNHPQAKNLRHSLFITTIMLHIRVERYVPPYKYKWNYHNQNST